MKKLCKISIWSICIMAALGILIGNQMEVSADEPLVIVIDPGHSGENLGAEYEQYTEKYMTMIVAQAMKEELEKYEDVVVYLTREDDTDMSIKNRALFAKEKQADFLFCLHFNMSVNHNLYGAEVWVPAYDEFYAKGYAFAEIEMEMLTELGLYSRGIKTKLNDKGENYYGILRYCSENQTPSVLIEHCHLDQSNDQPFYQTGEEQLKEFGRLDATAAAKYFCLKSEELGVDYSDYEVSDIPIPEQAVKPDQTEPEHCTIEVLSINEDTGDVEVKVKAQDNDSYILYYNYSLDGGNTYSQLFDWPRTKAWNQSESETTFVVTMPLDKEIELRACAYNGFDGFTESNILKLEPIPTKEDADSQKNAYQDINYDEVILNEAQDETDNSIWFLAAGIIVVMIILSIFLIKTIILLKRNNKRR